MKSTVLAFTLSLLTATCVHLALLIKNELRARELTTAQLTRIPQDSSLRGIDAKGNAISPQIGRDGRLAGNGYLVLFVIDKARIRQDVQYWDQVIELIDQRRLMTDAPIQYWGVCNGGIACNEHQSMARFAILGYLDPYQMHILAKTETSGAALVYDRSMILKGELSRTADPLALGMAIIGKAK